MNIYFIFKNAQKDVYQLSFLLIIEKLYDTFS